MDNRRHVIPPAGVEQLQGDPTHEMFMIKAGWIKLSKVLEDGREVILDFRKTNAYEYVIEFPLTHDELGYLLGAHRVSITRALKGLTESGKVVMANRTIMISRVTF